MISSDDNNVDVKDMLGLTKEQLDKSCTSGRPGGNSKAPSTEASHFKPGSMTDIKNINALHFRNGILSGD